MALEKKHDRGGLAAPVAGKLYQGIAARVHAQGDPLVYRTGPEYRDAAELKRVVDLLPGTPVIVLHPPNGGMIAEGAKPKIVGRVVSSKLDGDAGFADIFITDPEGDKALKRGIRELSLGYYAALDPETRNQIGTRLDHLALVPMGRCGATCRVRTDDIGMGGEADGKSAREKKGEHWAGDAYHGDRTAASGSQCGCEDLHGTADEPGLEDQVLGSAARQCACNNHANPLSSPGMDETSDTGDANADKHGDSKLTAKDRHALKSASFAVPSREALPIEDEGHVKDAMARFGQEQFQSSAEKRTAYHKILARAHELGMDPSGFEKKYGSRLDDDSAPDADEDTHMDETMKKQYADALKDAATQRARADQLDVDLAAAKTALTKAEVEATNAKASLAAATARADAADQAASAAKEQARHDASAYFDAAVNDRVDVLTAAARILPAKDKDGAAIDRRAQSNKALKIEMIKHVDGLDVSADKPDLYVDGVFLGTLERHATGVKAQATVRTAVETARHDNADKIARPSAGSTEQQARNKMIDRTNTAWSTDEDA